MTLARTWSFKFLTAGLMFATAPPLEATAQEAGAADVAQSVTAAAAAVAPVPVESAGFPVPAPVSSEMQSAEHRAATPPARALQPTAGSALLAPAFQASAASEEVSPLVGPVVQSSGRSGVGFMIAGGAALIAGLIIGGTAGDIIAVGGAVLGVYGIIIHF